jgi:hypothetical protein
MRRHASGQALMETLVAMLAFMPLLLSMVWLARHLDHQQMAIMAVREAAFQCPGGVADCNRRSDALPTTLQALSQARAVPWADPTGRSGPPRIPEMQVSRESLRFDAPLAYVGGSAQRVIPGALSLLTDLAGPSRFGLDLESGLVRTTVRISAGADAQDGRFDWASAFGVWRLEARLALLTDDWMARSPEGPAADTVRSRVDRGQQLPGLEPVVRAGWWPVRGLLQIAELLGLESSAQHFTPGQVDVDLLPPDRRGLAPWPGTSTDPDPVLAPDPAQGGGSSDGA